MINYYSEKEDRAFTLKVAKYNSLDEAEKEEMREEIVNRTYLLLYEIPIKQLYTSTDAAADIFLEAQAEIDDIISNFRICGITFNKYLTQVCRYKLLNKLRKDRERQLIEDSMCLKECEALYYTEAEERQRVAHYGKQRPEVEALTLPELFVYIIKSDDGLFESNSEKEKKLHKYLKNKIARKRFLLYLLSLPATEDEDMISNIARVLDIDYKVLAQFFIHKHTNLNDQYENRLKAHNTAMRHWITITRLNKALNTAPPEECNVIEKKLLKLKRCHQGRINMLKKTYGGMSQRDIADSLNMSRSTVSLDILRTKRKLIEIADEKK